MIVIIHEEAMHGRTDRQIQFARILRTDRQTDIIYKEATDRSIEFTRPLTYY